MRYFVLAFLVLVGSFVFLASSWLASLFVAYFDSGRAGEGPRSSGALLCRLFRFFD